MSIVITSDMQAQWSNLDLCQKASDEILDLCKKTHAKVLAYLGDGKQDYNPVDVRVTVWWQGFIRRVKKQGIRFIYELGNHDRVGQYTDADNWLPLLRRAGAETFDEPAVVDIGERRLFILPFCSPAETIKRADKLIKHKPDSTKDILLFHQDIKGARYNNQGSISDARLTSSDLHSDKYLYCIGGHLHGPQKVTDNVFYVGSPFCQDWGEVNQRKRYIVIRETGEVRSVLSKLPGWYDPDVSGFDNVRPATWNGVKLRTTVSCDASEDYGRRLDKARRHAEKKYRGATIYVVPRFIDNGPVELEGIKTTDSDERKVRQYVKHTQAPSRGLAIKYMLQVLSQFSGGLRTGSKVKFLYAEAKNFLSFKELYTDFRHKGITVIQGINKDRDNRSNGAGKTTVGQTIPVSLFGRTFKGQTHSRWSSRWNDKDPDYVTLTLRDAKGRKIKVTRGRRPTVLKMKVNGVDHSSGMKSTDKNGTQSQIEQVTGFTWQTLANAVYIDRTVADAFLSGTRKQRTEVLSRVQNLERFEQALKIVREDFKENQESIQNKELRLSRLRGSIAESEVSLENLQQLNRSQIKGAYKEYKRKKKTLTAWEITHGHDLKELLHKTKQVHHKYGKLDKVVGKYEQEHAIIESDLKKLRLQQHKLDDLKNYHTCPTCLQKISAKTVKLLTLKDKQGIKHLLSVQSGSLDKLTHYRRKLHDIDATNDDIQCKIIKLENKKSVLVAGMRTAQDQYQELASEEHSAKSILNKAKTNIKELTSEKKELKEKIAKLYKKAKMYNYVMNAFSRTGLPSFLNRQLCPVLNKAAEYYSELFSDKDIQVRFEIQEGEFVPIVINTKGGGEIEDQSTGERALAGLIASFALREVTPQCNLLVLDEPCEGVDAPTSKQFAKALQKLKHRFGSIWLTTHNIHILSELENERTITVVKKNGISRLQ